MLQNWQLKKANWQYQQATRHGLEITKKQTISPSLCD
jgi:hypothetical protein